MVQRVSTVAFEGIEARAVDVQVQVAPGLPAFAIVGLPDKAVSEARERVRSALIASGLALPARRITVNLAPADLPKEGSHYDLPIALGLMAAIGAHSARCARRLHGARRTRPRRLDCAGGGRVAGRDRRQFARGRLDLPRRLRRGSRLGEPGHPDRGRAIADPDRQSFSRHPSVVAALAEGACSRRASALDLRDIKGQESAKRALEIAAAGGHHLLMMGSPGAGKSMLAARLPSILPPLSPSELLEVSMIASVAGEIRDGALTAQRPFRSPHHSASMAALTGGGMRAKPGEISLSHHGVLFLDELPEFDPRVLNSLRQPLENGEVAVSRANHRVTYPARFMLVAAINPCRCGHAFEPGFSCKRESHRALHVRLSIAHLGPADGPHRFAHRGAGGERGRFDFAAAGRRIRRSRRARRNACSRPADARARCVAAWCDADPCRTNSWITLFVSARLCETAYRTMLRIAGRTLRRSPGSENHPCRMRQHRVIWCVRTIVRSRRQGGHHEASWKNQAFLLCCWPPHFQWEIAKPRLKPNSAKSSRASPEPNSGRERGMQAQVSGTDQAGHRLHHL